MRAHKIAREHTAVLKGLLRIRRYNQQGTPYALQKEEKISSGFDSEMLTRLCGAGAPFRPLFCPNPSFYVPGPKIFLPTTRPLARSPQHRGRQHPWQTKEYKENIV